MIQDDVVLRYGLLETFQQLGQDFEGALSDAKQQEQLSYAEETVQLNLVN